MDLVFTPGSFGNVDVVWEDPGAALFLNRLASFTRLIRFDRRGTSASDPLPVNALPHWESYADEVVAVMDAVGSERAAIMAMLDGGAMAMFFAATYPDRTTGLVLANTSARWVATDDDPMGIPREAANTVVDLLENVWGTDDFAGIQAPSRAGEERFRHWYAKYSRSIAGPLAVRSMIEALFDTDFRAILPTIRVPTLVVHRAELGLLPIEHGRYLAEHIPHATLVELPGADGPVYWEARDQVIDAVQRFLAEIGQAVEVGRSLATVLFTDIVGSTERARALGDRQWRDLLDVHDSLARRVVEEAGGRLIKTTGDGVLATFEGPGRGIRVAEAMRDDLRAVGLEIRAGLHTGEVELRGDDIGGMAVHLAARVMGEAGAGEIFVSRTVQDLVVGSGITFEDRGTHQLKGVEGTWQLFRVA
jgi:class 3 adenylate cyclase